MTRRRLWSLAICSCICLCSKDAGDLDSTLSSVPYCLWYKGHTLSDGRCELGRALRREIGNLTGRPFGEIRDLVEKKVEANLGSGSGLSRVRRGKRIPRSSCFSLPFQRIERREEEGDVVLFRGRISRLVVLASVRRGSTRRVRR